MATDSGDRVAVYIDFDNVIISRREQAARSGVDPDVDVDAILDFASSFGTLTTSRAYADWSRRETLSYRERLLSRAVDTIQMFTTSGKIKNAADIRLSIDVIEDLFLLRNLTHVVIVAGDSDYIPLAQRVKRLGRYVVGIGVAGSTSRLLAAACDEFYDYDDLPGLHADEGLEEGEEPEAPAESRSVPDRVRDTSAGAPAAGSGKDEDAGAPQPSATVSRSRATQLLLRALEYSSSKTEEEWHDAGEVKSQILRMEPAFQESALGFDSFSAFVRSRANLVELQENGNQRLVRLRPRRH